MKPGAKKNKWNAYLLMSFQSTHGSRAVTAEVLQRDNVYMLCTAVPLARDLHARCSTFNVVSRTVDGIYKIS